MSNDPTRPTWTDPSETQPIATPVAPSAGGPSTGQQITPPAGGSTPPFARVAAATTPVQPVTPAPAVAAKPAKGRSSMWANVLLGLAALIAVGGVAFAVGRSTAPAAASGITSFRGNGTNDGNGFAFGPRGSFAPGQGPGGALGGNFFRNGGPTIDGTVTAISADSMTIKLASGASVTMKLDGSTTYHQSTAASQGDVAVGDDVAVKVSGGRFVFGNGQGDGQGSQGSGQNGTTSSSLTASDVTVSQ